MRSNLQELKKKICNKTVFIVGGGPTVKDINISDLDDQLTIAINNSYKILPNATALYWCDASWIDKNLDQVNNHNCKLRFHARPYSLSKNTYNLKGIGDSTILCRTSEYGLDLEPDNVCGNNSGAHALNLAINMKAKNIVLLGYDMQIIERNTHWHKGHGYGLRPEIYPNNFIPSINSMAKKVKELGLNVNIINASTDSALTCFPFGSYKDYLS